MQLRMKSASSGHARNSLPVFFADVYARHPHTVRGGRCASNEVWPEIWFARRPRGPTSSFGTRSNAWKPRTSRPSARTLSVSHYKSALGSSVAGPARPAEWLNPSGSRVEDQNAGQERPLAFGHVVSRRLRRVGSTRTPDQQPCQWHLTPLPPCCSISSHSRRASDASMDASRSFLTPASARDHQCELDVAPGPATLSIGASRSGRGLHFCGGRLSLTGLHATCRHLRSIVATLAANDCSDRTPISVWWELVWPILNHLLHNVIWLD